MKSWRPHCVPFLQPPLLQCCTSLMPVRSPPDLSWKQKWMSVKWFPSLGCCCYWLALIKTNLQNLPAASLPLLLLLLLPFLSSSSASSRRFVLSWFQCCWRRLIIRTPRHARNSSRDGTKPLRWLNAGYIPWTRWMGVYRKRWAKRLYQGKAWSK